ncbi:hypothetical protein O181_051313 [Austropuccinia psidii MF-1]|uniref:Uncharacterized protein n=1 Tax=Austropuccinia psidii MF-1 TaxID=1389203 RepID=A0A9Q3HN85_9BASI|nr:hypothetical protein [Austropuccinia psidii MF-1]
MHHEQTMWQPTPGMSGAQWSEDSFHGKKKAIPFLILTFEVSELILLPFLEPSQNNEPPIPTLTPPIPGLSKVPVSQVPLTENDSTFEPETEVALTQSTEVPFGKYKIFPFFLLPTFPHPSFHQSPVSLGPLVWLPV